MKKKVHHGVSNLRLSKSKFWRRDKSSKTERLLNEIALANLLIWSTSKCELRAPECCVGKVRGQKKYSSGYMTKTFLWVGRDLLLLFLFLFFFVFLRFVHQISRNSALSSCKYVNLNKIIQTIKNAKGRQEKISSVGLSET